MATSPSVLSEEANEFLGSGWVTLISNILETAIAISAFIIWTAILTITLTPYNQFWGPAAFIFFEYYHFLYKRISESLALFYFLLYLDKILASTCVTLHKCNGVVFISPIKIVPVYKCMSYLFLLIRVIMDVKYSY